MMGEAEHGFPPEFLPHLQRMQSILPEVSSTTSDRACVLVVGSMLDNSLEVLLRTTFSANPQVSEKDCDFLLTRRPLPPLGSPSIRARLAFVLGLIDRKTLDAISREIEVRNDFAHNLTPLPLTEEIAAQLFNMLPDIAEEAFQEVDQTFILPSDHQPRLRFVASVLILCCCLDARACEIQMQVPKR